MTATRTLVVHCPDWPVVATGTPPETPAVVVRANRVVAASPAAQEAGVAAGQRRRQAQGTCPELVVHDADPGRDARAFEPVARAVEAFVPAVEVASPGRLALATRGPSRYFGGDRALAGRVLAAVDQVLVGIGWPGHAVVGVADGATAAAVAAHTVRDADRLLVVEPGASAAFLAPLPVSVLGHVELADVFARLGLVDVGDVAALDPAAVLARFGPDGMRLHRLANGLDEHPPDARVPPPELAVVAEIDPPAERVDTVAFVAKGLADELDARLGSSALACTRVLVVAETEHGERRERRWSNDGAFTAGAMADRVRWQLDGWLNGPVVQRPTAGVSLLRLIPDEVAPANGRQLGFWGGEAAADERVLRAVARLQGLLGTDAVTVPEHLGGRSPSERVVRVPAAMVDLRAPRPAARSPVDPAPWPGAVPAPSPSLLHEPPSPVDLLDAERRRVVVGGRGLVCGEPRWLASLPGGAGSEARPGGGRGGGHGREVRPGGGRGDELEVVAWAGPWPAEERWWDDIRRRRRARLQVLTRDGRAWLLVVEGGQWGIEAVYA